MADLKYDRLVTAYHGCDESVARAILSGNARLEPSGNAYDWLGSGIYFWEHGPQRAYEWAVQQASRTTRRVEKPAVLAEHIRLGICLDLLDTANTRLLQKEFVNFRRFLRQNKIPLPRNRDAPGARRGDKVLRFLDRAMIDYTIQAMAQLELVHYQTVRGVFVEGTPAFK